MNPQPKSIFWGMLSKKGLELRHPGQREEQHNLNTPPDHMPLGGKLVPLKGKSLTHMLRLASDMAITKKKSNMAARFLVRGITRPMPKEISKLPLNRFQNDGAAEVRRNNRFERFGVGPVEQPDAAEGQPEHDGKSMGTSGSEPTGEQELILPDLG